MTKTRKKNKKTASIFLFLLIVLVSVVAKNTGLFDGGAGKSTSVDQTIYFPSDKYPETAKHIKDAVAKGASPVCTIDRKGAEENRRQSLAGVATKKITTATNGRWRCAPKAARERISLTSNPRTTGGRILDRQSAR